MKDDETIVWIAGTNWDSVPGTDKRLVSALARHRHVLWIDPPKPMGLKALSPQHVPELMEVADGIMRVRVPAPPGVTRPVMRTVTARVLGQAIRHSLKSLHRQSAAVVVAFPLASFPAGVPGSKLLYVTDDWLGGSRLMGFSPRVVRNVAAGNVRMADAIAAVSPGLLEQMQRLHGAEAVPGQTLVLPNGCPEPAAASTQPVRDPVAGLVGQLNERLDLEMLEGLCSRGIPIQVIGPRTDRAPDFRRRMDRFLAAENVSWLGAVAAEELPQYLARLGVGLTPYADTAFNRLSFPLKTLEYLSAGLSVVSTELPSARWLASPHIAVGSDPADFTDHVVQALARRNIAAGEHERIEFARTHTWDNRARQLLGLLESAMPMESSLRGRTS